MLVHTPLFDVTSRLVRALLLDVTSMLVHTSSPVTSLAYGFYVANKLVHTDWRFQHACPCTPLTSLHSFDAKRMLTHTLFGVTGVLDRTLFLNVKNKKRSIKS